MNDSNGGAVVFEVVWPSGKVVSRAFESRPGLSELSGKTVCELNNGLHRGDEIFDIARRKLRERYPGVRFVKLNLPRGWDEYEFVAKLPGVLQDKKVDAVITGVGGGGGCALSFVRASLAAESVGIPSVTILSSAFVRQGQALAQGMGLGNLAIAEYPGVTVTDSDEVLQKKVEEVVIGRILEGLATPARPAQVTAQPERTHPVFAGTLAEVQEFFLEQAWSDGLPIVPPTVAEVERFLRFTDRSPEEIIGVIPVESREATVWNVAVNGVMAGCRPEYMPVLIAIAQVIADPAFHIEDCGATPGWEPLIILSGPIARELKLNHGAGVMKFGRQANSSIGRFLKLFMVNVVGSRIPPGVTDKGTIGMSFNVVLAEDEQAVADLGWRSFGMEQGFGRDDNVVTVQSVTGTNFPVYPGGDKALDFAETITRVWGQGPCAYWSFTGMFLGQYFPLLVITPRVAGALAEGGWTKDDLKVYLHKHAKVRASDAESWAWQTTGRRLDLPALVEKGRLPRDYAASTDPDRLVPVFLKPEWTGIVVAGDPWRNQVRGFVSNHSQGIRTSKRVELPQRWRDLRPQL